jgi:hypothetical protein
MADIFQANLDTGDVKGEFFFHATTIENIFKMIKYNSEGLKPIGSGQLGAGFYLTGSRSDYQKGMARRIRVSTDTPLFLLYVYVPGFYDLKPNFLDAWSNVDKSGAEFSAVCWYEKAGAGSVNEPERGGLIPSPETGKNVDFKYGQYRGEQIVSPDLLKKNKEEKLAFLEYVWALAGANRRPSYEEAAHYGSAAMQLAFTGPRWVFRMSLMELAIKSHTALAASAVVGAKLFSPSAQPLSLKFEYESKQYDLTSAIVEPEKLKPDVDPMNFHDESWVDLDEMLAILKK